MAAKTGGFTCGIFGYNSYEIDKLRQATATQRSVPIPSRLQSEGKVITDRATVFHPVSLSDIVQVHAIVTMDTDSTKQDQKELEAT